MTCKETDVNGRNMTNAIKEPYRGQASLENDDQEKRREPGNNAAAQSVHRTRKYSGPLVVEMTALSTESE